MTEAQKIQKELTEMNAKRKQVIKENSVTCAAPKCDRSFSYKPSGAL